MFSVLVLFCISSRAMGHGFASSAFEAAAAPPCNSCPSPQIIAPAPPCVCPPPQNIQDGIYLVSGQLSWTCGTSVQYQCSSGFRLAGPTSAKCQSSGWSEVPKCEEILCPTPSEIQNGIAMTSRPTVGSTVWFKCDAGYRLAGSESAVCQSDSTWSQKTPQCIEIQCPDPRPPRNGTVSTDGRRVGSKATYRCNAGYSVFGNETARCQPSLLDPWRADWSSPTPFCVLGDRLQDPRIWGGNKAGNLGGRGRRACGEPCQCPEPDKWLTNGFVKVAQAKHPSGLNYTVGTTVSYKCKDDYILKGKDKSTCRAGGKWSSKKPRCSGVYENYL